jgi:hypothetical protein
MRSVLAVHRFGPFTIVGAPGTREAPVAYCPRRTILDKLLVDAAAQSGAEVREGFAVEAVLIEDGRAVGPGWALVGDAGYNHDFGLIKKLAQRAGLG